jgi:hypothetical protein
MRRPLAALATLTVLLLVLASVGPPRVEVVYGADTSGCASGFGTPVGPTASPDIRAGEVTVNGMPAALWLQRFELGPNESLDGCFEGYTLLWVESGPVRISLDEGCLDETPGSDILIVEGTVVPDTPQTCDPGEFDLAAGEATLLVDALVTISSDQGATRAVVVMAAVEPDPELGCGGRPCPRP